MIKKTLLIVFGFLLVTTAVGQLNAQQWQVYDCSVLPDAHTPAWISSNTKTGVPTWIIMDDPDIPGNKYLEMLSPNVAAETAGMWKTDDFDPVPTAITVIARIKAAGDVSTYEEMIDLDMRINPLREKLIIGSDNKLDLDKADVQKTDGIDVSKWHTYRITFDVSTAAVDVYLDEDDTAVLSGTTSASESSQYFRFGDGSSGKTYGALIDWIAYDVSGAYAPGEGAPIPEELYVDKPVLGNIVFVSRPDKHDDINDVHPDSSHIDDLVAAGYNVTLFYNTSLSTASQATMDTLNNADLVIIGRSVASGIFGGDNPADKFAWNSVEAPIIAMHPYVVRSNRMNWFNTKSCKHYDDAGVVLNAVIEMAGDDVFDGLTLTDGTLPWAVGPYDVLVTKEAGNGELLASSAVDTNVLFVRFDPFVEFYAGAGDRPGGYRTMLGNGNDNSADPNTGLKIFNYNNFTTESKQVYLKEVARMVKLGTVELPVAVEEERHDIPMSYELYQNYPNPFNPTTTIEFSLPKFGHTKLTIYNVMGQVVETLVDREMTGGIHRITFRADRYSSGIYFYMLKSGDQVEVKKMMLLK